MTWVVGVEKDGNVVREANSAAIAGLERQLFHEKTTIP